jgi:carbon-monoxide dehydrogenase medium subunit
MGGTDIFVRLRDGVRTARYLVDVKKLGGMKDILFDPIRGLTLGAAVNLNQLIQCEPVQQVYPVLVQAAKTVASYQLRTRATLVGNICNASPAGDTTGACIVLGASLNIFGAGEYRQVPVQKFFLGPGKTVLNPGDIVTSIHIPIPPKEYAAEYIKLGRNEAGDLAIVGVTGLGFPDETSNSGFRFRLALASVAPVPWVPDEAEEILTQRFIDRNLIIEAAQSAMIASHPIDDVRASARYRKLMVRNLTQKVVTEVWKKIKDRE